MKVVLLAIIGLVLLALGTLFALQGAGIVHWPAGSSMLDHREWIERGILVAMFGVAALFGARRIR